MFNFFKKTALTRILFFVASDIAIIVFSIWTAFFLRFDGNIPSVYFPFIFRIIFLAIIFTVPIYYFHRLYSFSWAYVSTNEAISLVRATTISFTFLSIAIFISYYFPRFINFPRATIVISYALVLIFSGGLRMAKRIYLRINNKNENKQGHKTLIIGAGDAGEQILRSIISAKSPYLPCGFIDDSLLKQGITIHGLKVLGKVVDIPRIVENSQIKQVIIALPRASSKKISEAVDLARKAGVQNIKIVPPLSEIIRGEVSFENLKNVEVEDLLGRQEVVLDTKQIEEFIKNKKVLITGAAGSIGSELSRQVVKFNPSAILLLDQDESGVFNISKEIQANFPRIKMRPVIADIADIKKINKIFEEFRPEIVFHAAAYKHVPLMEEQPDEAVKNNIFGTENLAKACIDFEVEKFIQISTDKAVNPSSVMGATKRVCEMLCQVLSNKGKTKFISVRFGNVLNSRGSVIPIFREQIKKGGPIEVTHPEMKRYFMLTSEACLLVMQAGSMGNGGEVFVLDMGPAIKITDLAKEMIKMSGLEPEKDIAIVFTGIRPGEKLFEEMLTAEEGNVATKNKKIFSAKLSVVPENLFGKLLEELKNSTDKKEEIIKVLKKIVADYKA